MKVGWLFPDLPWQLQAAVWAHARRRILVDGEPPLELRLCDARGELIATGKSGSGLEYRLEVEPSPDFDPESEHPYTAHLDIPDLK
jgi:hypothetical protein